MNNACPGKTTHDVAGTVPIYSQCHVEGRPLVGECSAVHDRIDRGLGGQPAAGDVPDAIVAGISDVTSIGPDNRSAPVTEILMSGMMHQPDQCHESSPSDAPGIPCKQELQGQGDRGEIAAIVDHEGRHVVSHFETVENRRRVRQRDPLDGRRIEVTPVEVELLQGSEHGIRSEVAEGLLQRRSVQVRVAGFAVRDPSLIMYPRNDRRNSSVLARSQRTTCEGCSPLVTSTL